MGGEEDASHQREESSSRRKHHKHSSKCRSSSLSRSENRHSKKLKRKRQSSCESSNRSASNSESSRSVSPAHKKRKKCKDKKTKRHSDKLKKKKKKKHHHHHHHKKDKDAKLKTSADTKAVEDSVIGPAAPRNIGPKSCTKTTDSGSQKAASVRRSMKPMTKEEWEKKQSEVRRVYDPETGRHRLVRGEGEIIEEIVSRDRHKEINKVATRGDGLFYQLQAGLAKKH